MTPFEVLGLPPSATPAEVKARWRELRTQLHPDHGGDTVKFNQAQRAYEKAYLIALKCRACGGTGKQVVNNGFSQLTVRCPVCKGTRESGGT